MNKEDFCLLRLREMDLCNKKQNYPANQIDDFNIVLDIIYKETKLKYGLKNEKTN